MIAALSIAVLATAAAAAPTTDGVDGAAGADGGPVEAPLTVLGQSEGDEAPPPLVEPCAAEPPADHAAPEHGAETIGYVAGYWYDEPIDVDVSDGLSEPELERLAARSAARFEALRCLEFTDGLPTIDLVDRGELSNRTAEQFGDVSPSARRFDNAVLSTMLLVGDTEDSVEARQESRSETVAGYYDLETERIVVVEPSGNGSALDESVLVHEIGHALQDQTFDLGEDHNETLDQRNGRLGLIEGDVSLVETRYLQRCEAGRWAAGCATTEDGSEEPSGENSTPPNWGLYLQQFQPYSDGPAFVQHVEREGGWAAVDALYEDVPESALEIMAPERRGELDIEHPQIESPGGDWSRLHVPDAPDHETVGPAGLGAMVIAPTYEDRSRDIVSPLGVLNLEGGEVAEIDPLNYDQAPVTGWRGDRLAVFASGNETATVWRLSWETDGDATEFADAYEQLLEIRNASAVDGPNRTYRFQPGSEYDGVHTVRTRGDSVLIVSAPNAAAVTELAPALDPEHESGAGTDGTAPAQNETTGGSAGRDDSNATADGEDPLPGFGVVAALSALLAALTLIARRS